MNALEVYELLENQFVKSELTDNWNGFYMINIDDNSCNANEGI